MALNWETTVRILAILLLLCQWPAAAPRISR
jgi:hypothetical protein